MNPTHKRSLIVWVLGHIIPAYHAYMSKFHQLEDVKEKYIVLADGFFIPAVFLLGVGVLVWISRTGQFAGLSYSIYLFASRFRLKKDEKVMSYAEYLKKYKVGTKESLWPLFLPGLYFFAVNLIFNILHGF